MTGPTSRDPLRADLAALETATARLLDSLEPLGDAAWREPSLLPGWTRADTAGHIARNAEALVRLVGWARTGVPSPMYASVQDRAEGIESAAALPGPQLRTLVAASAEALDAALAGLADADDEALDRLVYFGAQEPVGGPDTPARELAWARLREVEIHHLDLGLDYGPHDWPPGFVDRALAWIEARTGGTDVVGAPAEVLAWRLGRGAGPTVRATDGGDPPEPPPW